MKIFAAEINDGLEEQLKAQASITYASQLEPDLDHSFVNSKDIKALAGIEDKDLYYTQSILVTTSWNKNDDIFDKEEVWAAKNTPVHKPTNLEHDEGTIVGHITANWPIDNDGNLIEESTLLENLPTKYHILTGSVIYNGYTEPELKERSQKLISEIENGTKYVSMECFFKAFDYGLINKTTNEYKILSRNDETAFLTKHLRAYGGVGEYQDHKIGRVLRQITFSGKGFVDKPANPESVIFTKKLLTAESSKEKNNDFLDIGVFSIQANLKENEMSLEKEVTEIKEKIEAMSQCENDIAEAKTLASDLKSKNEELSQKLQATELELSEVKTVVSEKEEAAKKMAEDMKKKDEEMQKMKADLDATNEILAAYKDKEAEMVKKEKKMKRMATLIETGLDTELATSTVEKFEGLDDEAFSGMTEVFAAMTMKKKAEKMKEEEAMMMKKKASEETSEILETAETEETIDLTVGGEDQTSEVENTRAALVDFVYNRLGKKLNKGE